MFFNECKFILVMLIHLGVYIIMKKIIILLAFFLTGSCLSHNGAYSCPIDSPGACKADISRGMNNSLRDKMLPNNLDKTVYPPNSTIEMREQTQPQTPSIINTESRPQNPQGYDANCQFGNCMNKTPESEVSR